MHICIIGSAGSGKTTFFRALSGIDNGSEPGSNGIAVIDVPDERLDRLSDIFNPRKTVCARIELADTIAIEEGNVRNETINQKALQHMRSSDALLLVLPYFDREAHDATTDLSVIRSEFILSDMAQIETRLERMEKQNGKRNTPQFQQEKSLLEGCLAHLESGEPLSTYPLTQTNGDEKALRGFRFLSQKPVMVVVNCAEGGAAQAETIAADIRQKVPGQIPVLVVCGKLEAELALMPEEERLCFMEEFGIKESVRNRIIRLAYETLGLISFFTVGEDECRAWPIRKMMTAQEAAGTIHSDFYDKFIRAETVAYDCFITHGGFAGCKKAGVWRLEGKTYTVQDGDILSIRAGN